MPLHGPVYVYVAAAVSTNLSGEYSTLCTPSSKFMTPINRFIQLQKELFEILGLLEHTTTYHWWRDKFQCQISKSLFKSKFCFYQRIFYSAFNGIVSLAFRDCSSHDVAVNNERTINKPQSLVLKLLSKENFFTEQVQAK